MCTCRALAGPMMYVIRAKPRPIGCCCRRCRCCCTGRFVHVRVSVCKKKRKTCTRARAIYVAAVSGLKFVGLQNVARSSQNGRTRESLRKTHYDPINAGDINYPPNWPDDRSSVSKKPSGKYSIDPHPVICTASVNASTFVA